MAFQNISSIYIETDLGPRLGLSHKSVKTLVDPQQNLHKKAMIEHCQSNNGSKMDSINHDRVVKDTEDVSFLKS